MTDKHITFRQLLEIQPINDREKQLYNINQEILDSIKSDLEKNIYYLYGQLKLGYDDEITAEDFNMVRAIDKEIEFEYRGPCNSWQTISINEHRRQFFEIEKLFQIYSQIMKWREETK